MNSILVIFVAAVGLCHAQIPGSATSTSSSGFSELSEPSASDSCPVNERCCGGTFVVPRTDEEARCCGSSYVPGVLVKETTQCCLNRVGPFGLAFDEAVFQCCGNLVVAKAGLQCCPAKSQPFDFAFASSLECPQ